MLDYYFELKITPNIDDYDTFLELAIALSSEAIEEDNGVIILRSEDDLSEIEFGIRTFAQKLNIECKTSLQKLKNEDWVNLYKQSIEAIEVGEFYILPSWEESKSDLINIFIDPSLSFGSGHHETTSNCLVAISKYIKKDFSVVDVGCGSGILGIAAVKKGAIVDICDTDEKAFEDAKENFKLNNCAFEDGWSGSILKASKRYDVVVANIVADVLVMISKDLKKSMKENGILILSGILDKHLSKVQSKYSDLKQLEIIKKNEWITLVYSNQEDI